MEIRIHGFTLGMGGKSGVKVRDKAEDVTFDLKVSDKY